MKAEVYRAMRERISVLPYGPAKAMYDEKGYAVSKDAVFYKFNADGIGEDVNSFVQPMETKNMYNVVQRFYSFIKDRENIDFRLINNK